MGSTTRAVTAPNLFFLLSEFILLEAVVARDFTSLGYEDYC